MSNFSILYEDPEYDDRDKEPNIYIEPGVIKDFDQWSIRSQLRLMEDIFSPFNTINS